MRCGKRWDIALGVEAALDVVSLRIGITAAPASPKPGEESSFETGS
jgi:hypothetical protein